MATKLCKDCKHAITFNENGEPQNQTWWTCAKLSTVRMTDGSLVYENCAISRVMPQCGPDGKLFEANDG